MSYALTREDIARVQAHRVMQCRSVESWQAMAPLLADIERIMTTKHHLLESVQLGEALGHLPYVFGHS